MRLNWSNGSLTMTSRGEEVGAISTSVRARIQGEEARIAFNIRYLLDYLQGKLGMVLLETSAPSSPARFFHGGSPHVLLMPLFVSDPAVPTREPAAHHPAVDGPADAEAPEEPPDDQKAPVDEGTPEALVAADSPSTRRKKPRLGK